MALSNRICPCRRLIGWRWGAIMIPIPCSAANRRLSGVRAAIHVGGHGRWKGRRTTVTSGNLKYVPAYAKSVSVHARRIISRASCCRAAASGSVMPSRSYSYLKPPRPNPISRRPCVNWSASAAWPASNSGS